MPTRDCPGANYEDISVLVQSACPHTVIIRRATDLDTAVDYDDDWLGSAVVVPRTRRGGEDIIVRGVGANYDPYGFFSRVEIGEVNSAGSWHRAAMLRNISSSLVVFAQ